MLVKLLRYQPMLPQRLENLLMTITTYLPSGLAHQLLENPTTETRPIPLEGTVVFADVDGFTALAERFSTEASNAGAEEVTELVNRFLALLIHATKPYGGDLQKFGGDAGLLLFTGEKHAFRATAAALETQRAMEALAAVETSLGCFPFQIAIGIASGPLLTVGLGTSENRKWLLTGPPLHAMGRAQQAAPPGGVVLHASSYEQCDQMARCTPLGTSDLYLVNANEIPEFSFQAPTLPRLPEPLSPAQSIRWLLNRLDALSPYLDPELLARLTALSTLEHFRLWSEYRQVTILIIALDELSRLVDFKTRPEALQTMVTEPNNHFVLARNIIRTYDGIVNKIGIGPGGAYLMALFGAPQAHEDDPLRAVLAALELQERVGVPLQIGINTGFVFAGDVGTDERREYTVMGDEVNLAYRLMSKCEPGKVWLGPNTAHHSTVTRRIKIKSGPAQHLKGKRELVTPFIAQETQATITTADRDVLPLTGREDEFAILQKVLEKIQDGNPQTVLLHGSAGSGKSRLIHELSQQMESDQELQVGTAPSYGAHLPYAVWERPLRALLRLDDVPTEAQADILRRVLAHQDQEMWTALITPLVGLDISPSPEVEALSPELRETQRQATLRALLSYLAQEQPLVLALENAQWMPAPSLRLVTGLIQAPPTGPVLLIVTGRDEGDLLEQWRSSHDVIDLSLGPLSTQAMTRLAEHAAGRHALPADVKRWIVKRGSGSPLFAIEAIRALQSAGLLTSVNGAWRLTQPLDDAPLPDSTYGLIQSRIDQLEPPSRHLLRAATVVGEQMTVPMLTAGYGEEPRAVVQRRLSDLAQLGLVYSDYGENVLLFRQPLVREVAYRGLPHRIRRHIHRNLSQYLKQHQEQATSNWFALLAHHAFEGQLWEIARHANLDLGKRLLENYMTEQAIQALTRALQADQAAEASPAQSLHFTIHKHLGETYTILGQYDDAMHHLGAARDLLPTPLTEQDDIERSADLDYRLALIWKSQGKIEKAFEAIETGLGHQTIHQTLIDGQLRLLGAGMYYRQGDYQHTWDWAQAAVDQSRSIPHAEARKVRARGLYLMALVRYKESNLQTALELGLKSLQIYQEIHELLGEVDARTNLMIIYLLLGEWAAAAEHGEQALRLARRIQYTIGEMRVAGNLGEIYRYQGRLDEAREAYNTVLQIVQERGIAYGEAVMENNLAAVAIKESNWQEAGQRLRRAEQILHQMGKGATFPELYRHRGQIALAQGRPDAALRHAQRCLDLTKERADRQEMGRAHEFLGSVYFAMNAHDKANAHLQQACAFLQEAEDLYGLAQARVAQAKLQWEQGEKETARKTLKAASGQFRSLGARLDLQQIAEIEAQWTSDKKQGIDNHKEVNNEQ